MKQVVQSYRTGRISVEEVPVPQCGRGDLLVRTAYSLISIGTERSIIDLGRKSLIGKARARPDLVRRALVKGSHEGYWKTFQEALARIDTPTPLGYSAAGTVIEAGDDVEGIGVGDRVACMGAGFASHAEVLSIPRNLCAAAPDGVGLDEAAFGMLGSIALHGVRLADAPLGSRVGVIGLGLLGLLSAQIFKASGCSVFACDLDSKKTERARGLGVDWAVTGGDSTVSEAAGIFSRGRGLDAVLIAASADDSGPIRLAAEICRVGGRVILAGVARIEIPRQILWEKEIDFKVSKAAGPGSLDPTYEQEGMDYPYSYVRWTEGRNLEAFLDLLASHRVDVKTLITHRFDIEEALKAYEILNTPGGGASIGMLLRYSGACDIRRVLPSPRAMKTNGAGERVRIGVIGAGLFGKSVLLPALRKTEGVRFGGVATAGGITANDARRKFGFDYCVTDYRVLLDDKDIDAVLILTRHSLHARMVRESLAADKHVFVEKPLCVNEGELAMIAAAVASAPGRRLLMVGYNRRFAPLAVQLKSHFPDGRGPFVMTCRINVGFLPPEHWVFVPAEGGGRIIGELCHFVDLCQFYTDSVPVNVYARAISGTGGRFAPRDNVCVNMKFQDGSIAALLYTSSGDRAYSRERIELFSSGRVGVLEDFRRIELAEGGKTRVTRRWNRDMGYRAELNAFIGAVRAGEGPPVPFDQAAASSMTTFRIMESLATGRSVPIEDLKGDGSLPSIGEEFF